jgi:hypothetical protein
MQHSWFNRQVFSTNVGISKSMLFLNRLLENYYSKPYALQELPTGLEVLKPTP